MASIADALQEALRHHRHGALAEAEILYRRILAVEPVQADALNLLARLCLQTDRAAAALDLAAQAVRAAPAILSYQLTLADCARVLGRPGPLIAALTAAAALAPDRADLFHQLGVALAGQGADAAALTALTEARRLAPADAAILNDGAVALARAGRAADAEHWLDQALALGDSQAAANLHGLMLAQASLCLDESAARATARAEAERLSRRAVALAPADARGWLLLGQALAAGAQLEAAWDAYRRARDLGGDAVEIAIVAGDCLTRLGRFDDADALLRPALAAHPDNPSLLNNTGILRHCQGRLDEARSLFERAIAAAPADHRPLVNLGTLLKDIGDDDGADNRLRRALALAPDDPAVHWQYALARLMAGDFATGWREYEWRWRTGKLTPGAALPALPPWPARLPAGDPLPPGVPPLTGLPLAGLKVLVECEQGHGDTLHFIRYVPRLRALGAVVGVAAQPAVVRLLTLSLPGVPVSAIPAGPPPGVWDCRVPLMSLPYRLAPWLGDDFIPAEIPYLFPDAGEAAAWRHRLAGLPADTMKVGLVWAGDPRRDDPLSALIDKRRSVSPAALAPLAAIPGITWISLQKGGAGRPQWPFADRPLIDWTGELGDFADTAALVAGLDLVVTVDTAVAHLAGGLGRPVWVLSRYDGCWRWQHRRDDSPWYPTLRLFRQTDWHDWSAAVADLARALAAPRGRGLAAHPGESGTAC